MYIYRLLSEKGSSYIGQRSKDWKNDSYMGSSSYFNRDNKEEKKEKVLLRECEDAEQLDLWESFLICADRMLFSKKKNVNRNYGAYLRNERMVMGWNKGLKGVFRHTEEAKRKISEAGKKRKPHPNFIGCRKGKKFTPEQCKRISQGNIKRFSKKEEHEKLSMAHKELKCFNDGVKNIWAKTCPDGFVKGRININVPQAFINSSLGKKWYTDGIKSIQAFECPIGFRPGRTMPEGMGEKVSKALKGKTYDERFGKEKALEVRKSHSIAMKGKNTKK
jgi:hypothetical protein